MGRRDTTRQLPVLRSRSLSPNVPYLYPDKQNEALENKYRKGWYRVDYGGTQTPEMWFLPRFNDRLKFLERHVDTKILPSNPYPRASSVPPVSVTERTMTKPSRPSTPTHYYTKPLDYYRHYSPYSSYSWRYPYSSWRYPYSDYGTSMDTALALARADRALNRSYYRGYNRYLPSSSSYYYDYDYYYPSLRTSSYLDDDYPTYRYRPRVYDFDDYYRASSVPRSISYSSPTTKTYYLTY